MKTSIVEVKSILFISLCLLLLNTAVQASGQSKEDLQGKWELEQIFAIENNVQRTISVDGLGFEIPSKIEIQQEEIIFVRASCTSRAKYNTVVKDNLFYFSVCAQWKIMEKKLHLQ